MITSELHRVAPFPVGGFESHSKNSGFRAIYPNLINANLTIVIFACAIEPLRTGIHSTEPTGFPRALAAMARSDKTNDLSWPWWAPWALLAVAATSLLTVAATLYDIL